MRTYLLTWNPEKYHWDSLKLDIEKFEKEGSLLTAWSCGVTRSIVKGDRVFMMRLGGEPRGIFASGYVEGYDALEGSQQPVRDDSDVYEGEYWGDDVKRTLYVNARLDRLFDPFDTVLPLASLKQIAPKQKWTPQNSGISIREEVSPKLDEEWTLLRP